jgi:hypothetical protein
MLCQWENLVDVKRADHFCRVLVVETARAILAVSLIFEWWVWARIPEMNPRFADLRLITSTADCVRKGGWEFFSKSCDIWGREYNYPTIWARTFGFFGLGEKYTVVIGLLIGLILISTFATLAGYVALHSRSWLHLIFVCASMVSPPVALLLERGNADMFVVILIVLAAFCFEKKPLLSALLSSLATGLKLFPGLVGVYFLHSRIQRYVLFVFVLFTVILVIPSVDILGVISQRTPKTRGYSFGASSSLAIFAPGSLSIESIQLLPINLLITVGSSAFLYMLRPEWFRNSARHFTERSFGASLFDFGGLAFIGTYLAGTRFDYSLALLVLVITAISLSDHREKLLLIMQCLIIISLWCAFGTKSDSAIIGDLAASSVAVIYLSICIGKLSLARANKSRFSRRI